MGPGVAYLRPGVVAGTGGGSSQGGGKGGDGASSRDSVVKRVISYLGSDAIITGRVEDVAPSDEQNREERHALVKKGMLNLLLFCIICVIASVIGHSVSKRYFLVSAIAAVVLSVSYLVLVMADQGVQEPVFLIVLDITRGLIAFAMSLVVGLPFLFLRKRAGKAAHDELIRKLGTDGGSSPPPKGE